MNVDVDSSNGKKMDRRSSHTISILKMTSLLFLLLYMITGKIQKVTVFLFALITQTFHKINSLNNVSVKYVDLVLVMFLGIFT